MLFKVQIKSDFMFTVIVNVRDLVYSYLIKQVVLSITRGLLKKTVVWLI